MKSGEETAWNTYTGFLKIYFKTIMIFNIGVSLKSFFFSLEMGIQSFLKDVWMP